MSSFTLGRALILLLVTVPCACTDESADSELLNQAKTKQDMAKPSASLDIKFRSGLNSITRIAVLERPLQFVGVAGGAAKEVQGKGMLETLAPFFNGAKRRGVELSKLLSLPPTKLGYPAATGGAREVALPLSTLIIGFVLQNSCQTARSVDCHLRVTLLLIGSADVLGTTTTKIEKSWPRGKHDRLPSCSELVELFHEEIREISSLVGEGEI